MQPKQLLTEVGIDVYPANELLHVGKDVRLSSVSTTNTPAHNPS